MEVSGGSGGNVDLTGYATEQYVQDYAQPKGNYLTEHQDISGKLDASALPTAINTALAQAKASGEFDGADGKDGVSATHSWNGTTLTITSASGTSSANLKGEKGEQGIQGEPGTKGDKGDTGPQGPAGADGAKGDKGDKGDPGEKGADGAKGDKGDKGDTGSTGSAGKDGTSVTVKSVSESTADGGSNVVTFSDGKTVTIKNGSKGSTGATGAAGPAGIDGKDYVLTAADKAEIAEQVENATIVQAPKYVNTVEEMTDVNRPYVLISTGRIWANAQTTVEKEVTVTDNIVATSDNPYKDGNRFGSSGDGFSNDATGYHVTPLIDLTKYAGKTIQIHLEGCQYASTGTYAQWIQCRTYGNDKAVLAARPYTADVGPDAAYLMGGTNGVSVKYNSATSATITLTNPTYGGSKIPIGYIRFCGKGAVANSKISITYQAMQTTTGVQWFDTGTSYAPNLSAEEKQAMVEEVASMVDAQLLAVIGDGVVTV